MGIATDTININQPGLKVSTIDQYRDTNRGNPLGDKVDNTSGTDVATATKTQKMGKRGTMGPSMKLPSGKLYQKT
jgi:hypothetical protein